MAAQWFAYATVPVIGAYGAELFATRERARSAGLVGASSAVGGVVGLLATGALAGATGGLGPALSVMAIGPVVLAVLLLVAYPESAGLDLAALEASPAAATSHVATISAASATWRRKPWSAPSINRTVTGPVTSLVASDSSSVLAKASRVPETNRHGTRSLPKCSVRRASGLPGE